MILKALLPCDKEEIGGYTQHLSVIALDGGWDVLRLRQLSIKIRKLILYKE